MTRRRDLLRLAAGATDGPLAPSRLLRPTAGFANEGRKISEQRWDREGSNQFGWTFGEGTGPATSLS